MSETDLDAEAVGLQRTLAAFHLDRLAKAALLEHHVPPVDGAVRARGPYDDDVIVNFGVWESREQLWDFVYRSEHLDFLRRDGPTPEAFTFRQPFEPPVALSTAV